MGFKCLPLNLIPKNHEAFKENLWSQWRKQTENQKRNSKGRDKIEENVIIIKSLKKLKQKKYFSYEGKTKLNKKGTYRDKKIVLVNYKYDSRHKNYP